MDKQIRLSASTFKTWLNCSYLFYLEYKAEIPKSLHPALPKGTLTHLILELLLRNDKRKKLAKAILKKRSVEIAPSIIRLINKHLNKHHINTPSNWRDIENWLLVGLQEDFFGKGSLDIKTEFQFKIKIADYWVTGTIDKIIFYKDHVVLRDFKSSKAKFAGEEATLNLQAMLYTYIASQLFPGYKRYDFEFIFLRFPRNPIQRHYYPSTQLEGFMKWIEYLIPQMANVNEETAQSHFAADDKNKSWLCRAGATWKCPYLEPYDYYIISDSKGNIINKTLDIPTDLPKKYTVSKERYAGCIRHLKYQQREEIENFFEND